MCGDGRLKNRSFLCCRLIRVSWVQLAKEPFTNEDHIIDTVDSQQSTLHPLYKVPQVRCFPMKVRDYIPSHSSVT